MTMPSRDAPLSGSQSETREADPTANGVFEERRRRQCDHSLPPLYKHDAWHVCPRCFQTFYLSGKKFEAAYVVRDCVEGPQRASRPSIGETLDHLDEVDA